MSDEEVLIISALPMPGNALAWQGRLGHLEMHYLFEADSKPRIKP